MGLLTQFPLNNQQQLEIQEWLLMILRNMVLWVKNLPELQPEIRMPPAPIKLKCLNAQTFRCLNVQITNYQRVVQ